MKGDMNLIVKFLEYCEKQENDICDLYFDDMPNYSINEIFDTKTSILREHTRLAKEAGLVEIRFEIEMSMNLRLTYNGYDFLETVRKVPASKWREICQSGFATSIEVIKGVISGIAVELGVKCLSSN